MERQTDGLTDGRTDGRYRVHYHPVSQSIMNVFIYLVEHAVFTVMVTGRHTPCTLRKELCNPLLLQSHMSFVYLPRNIVDNNKVNLR